MSRTNVDIDERACENVMRRYGLKTKREAINYALRQIAEEPLSYREALDMRGAGWDADLNELRRDEEGSSS